jgi:fucose permease
MVFAVGRFLVAFAQYFVKPRFVLLVAYIGMIVFATLCIYIPGSAGVIMGLLLFLFESGTFSTIFAISLRGMAQHTKTAAAILTTAISGGFLFPFPQYALCLSRGAPYSFHVTVVLFAASAIFPLYLNLVPAARKQVDPIPNEYLHYPRSHKQPRGA